MIKQHVRAAACLIVAIPASAGGGARAKSPAREAGTVALLATSASKWKDGAMPMATPFALPAPCLPNNASPGGLLRPIPARVDQHPKAAAQLSFILANEQRFIDNPAFHEPDAYKTLFDGSISILDPDVSWYQRNLELKISRPSQAMTGRPTTLMPAEEKILFLRFNYSRYRIYQLRENIAAKTGRGPSRRQRSEIISWSERAAKLRDNITNFNIALVLAVLKRVRAHGVDTNLLVAEGNVALLNAVDMFDVGRGFKFSTYAYSAILKRMQRIIMQERRHRARYGAEYNPIFQKDDSTSARRRAHELAAAEELGRILDLDLADLTPIETTVIRHRFSIGSPDQPPMSLEETGKIVGVTKEAARKIQNRAMEKIKAAFKSIFYNEKPAGDLQPSVPQN